MEAKSLQFQIQILRQAIFGAAIQAAFAGLFYGAAADAAERVLADQSQGGIRVKVVELQAPEAPKNGVSFQAAHELQVQATATGVQITRIQVTPGKNVSRASGGNPVSGYLYLDAMPNRTVRTIVLAEDSAKAFSWSVQVGYRVGDQAQSLRQSITSSGTERNERHASTKPAMDVSALLADPVESRPSAATENLPVSQVGNLAALLADPAQPAAVERLPESVSSGGGESLQNALALRDRERERKAYVAQVESLRNGLREEQKLLRNLVATTSREHVQVDQRREEARRRAEAAAKSAKDGRLIMGLIAGGVSTVLAHNAGMANAGELGGRLGIAVAKGNVGSGLAEYSSGMSSGMNQRLAELETQRQVAAAQPQPLTAGQRLYRESVARSEAGRQQLIAQGTLANTRPSPSVAAVLATPPPPSAASHASPTGNYLPLADNTFKNLDNDLPTFIAQQNQQRQQMNEFVIENERKKTNERKQKQEQAERARHNTLAANRLEADPGTRRDSQQRADADRREREAKDREAKDREARDRERQQKADAARQEADERRAKQQADRLAEAKAKEDATKDYLRRLAAGTRLAGKTCGGEPHIGGSLPKIRPQVVTCVDVHFRAYCPGSSFAITGAIKNMIGMASGCFGDTAKIKTDGCKAEELRVEVVEARVGC